MWVTTRHRLVGAAAASLAAALLPRPLVAEVALKEHKHGINGLSIPMDRAINLTTQVLDGPDWSLQSARGNVVFMNFFATWCPPCVL